MRLSFVKFSSLLLSLIAAFSLLPLTHAQFNIGTNPSPNIPSSTLPPSSSFSSTLLPPINTPSPSGSGSSSSSSSSSSSGTKQTNTLNSGGSNGTPSPPTAVFTPVPQVNSPVINRSIFKDSHASPSVAHIRQSVFVLTLVIALFAV